MATPVPFSKLSVVDAMVLFSDAFTSLKANGIVVMGADGHWSFESLKADELMAEIAAVEKLLSDHGVILPEKVQKFIPLLPSLLALLQ